MNINHLVGVVIGIGSNIIFKREMLKELKK